MIKKVTAAIDDYFWIEDDDSPDDKASYYKFGITVNAISIAMLLVVYGIL